MNPLKKIDLSKILKQKSPFFYRIIPEFLINKLAIVRERDINKILEKLDGKEKLEFVKCSLKELGVKSQN